MVTTASASSSLKDYLKRYESNTEEEKKRKKKKKKTKPVVPGVLVVDEDPVWQKPVNLEEDEENDSPDEKPLVDEDIEVKRMRRLEQIRARRAYNELSQDGSGWVSVSDAPNCSTSADLGVDISPSCKRTSRYDTPSPENRLNQSDSGREDADLSPPRQRHGRNDSPSPEPEQKPSGFKREGSDLSLPRQCRGRHDSPSSQHELKCLDANVDLSPPRQHRRCYDSPSPERGSKGEDLGQKSDVSIPRRRGRSSCSPLPIPEKNPFSGVEDTDLDDLSPPRRVRPSFPKLNNSLASKDLSPPRKSKKGIGKMDPTDNGAPRMATEADLSPPRKRKDYLKTGLITGKDVSEEIAKTKKDEWSRFKEMDPLTSGRGAEPVYRIKGERVSKDEYLKLTKKEKKPKEEEKKLEWGKGLAQKREAETRLLELELEKDKPFARSRDDPDLDRMMKDRLRWGDPMAHLVKKKQSDLLPDFGESEKMKESGFIIPQDVPSHSWIKRGLDFEPNRYGIKPGRHWDGVDRSNGYERQLFKRTNEKRATEREAYLWSVSDM